MDGSSLSLKRLDAATRSLHAAADERWLALLRPDVSLLEYAAQLERSYGVIAPYDAALAYLPQLTVRPRVRTSLLVRDLLALGRTPHHIALLPMCLAIDIPTADAALGWIYVFERSAIVHAGLLRHLKSRLPIAHASAFLEGNPRCMGPIWDDLGRALDRTAALEDVVASARHAFAVQAAWFARDDRDAGRSYG